MLSLLPIIIEGALSPLIAPRVPLVDPVDLGLDSDVCKVEIKIHRRSPKPKAVTTEAVTTEAVTTEDSAQAPLEIAETLSSVVENEGNQPLQQHESIAVEDNEESQEISCVSMEQETLAELHSMVNKSMDADLAVFEAIDEEEPQSKSESISTPVSQSEPAVGEAAPERTFVPDLFSEFDKVMDKWHQDMDNIMLSTMDAMKREMRAFSMPAMGLVPLVEECEIASSPNETTTAEVVPEVADASVKALVSVGSTDMEAVEEPSVTSNIPEIQGAIELNLEDSLESSVASPEEAVSNNEDTYSTDVNLSTTKSQLVSSLDSDTDAVSCLTSVETVGTKAVEAVETVEAKAEQSVPATKETVTLAVERTTQGKSDNIIKRRNQYIMNVISTYLDRE